MARKTPVIKAKLHAAAKSMTTAQMDILTKGDPEVANRYALLQKAALEERQDKIDHYNHVVCNTIDPFFDTLQLNGSAIIVRMHRENLIKKVTEYSKGVPLYDAWISQVDGRMHQSERAKWVDNPLPYISTGVVVSISPMAKASFVAERVKLNEISKELGDSYKELQVGDTVHLEHIMFADKRFYINKQERDFLKNPMEYRIENWEGYIKIHPSVVESIVLEPETLLEKTSALVRYRKQIVETDSTKPAKSAKVKED